MNQKLDVSGEVKNSPFIFSFINADKKNKRHNVNTCVFVRVNVGAPNVPVLVVRRTYEAMVEHIKSLLLLLYRYSVGKCPLAHSIRKEMSQVRRSVRLRFTQST